MLAGMQISYLRLRRHRPAPAALRRLASGRALVVAATLVLAACSNGTDAVPSLDTGVDQLVGDKSPGALLRIADATRAGGDPANAIALYRRAHELAPKDPTPLARLGATFAETRSYTEAVAAYRQPKTLAPQDQEIARGLGAVLLALGKPQLALAELTAALGQHRDEPHLLNL